MKQSQDRKQNERILRLQETLASEHFRGRPTGLSGVATTAAACGLGARETAAGGGEGVAAIQMLAVEWIIEQNSINAFRFSLLTRPRSLGRRGMALCGNATPAVDPITLPEGHLS